MLEFKRKKRAEEKAKERRGAKDKSYEDYPWTELCEDATEIKNIYEIDIVLRLFIKKLRVPEVLKPPRAEAAFEEQLSARV